MSAFPPYVSISPDGYNEAPGSITARGEMDRGVAKQRRTQTDAIIALALKLIFLTAADADAFETWYYSADGAGAGTTWFDWVDPRTGITRQARCIANALGPLGPIADAAGFGLTTRTLQIEFVRQL